MAWFSRLTGGVTAIALLLFMAANAQAGGLKDGPPAPPPPAPKKWLPWVEGGGFLSTEQNRAETNVFAPLWQSSVALLFFQGTGKYFEDDIREGNFDIGFRKMHRSGWNFGVWGGYDVRETEEDNTFHQISFGVEALSDRWDVRANGYVAVSDPEASPGLARVFVTGNNIFMTGGEEVPLSGFDGEVGYKVFSRRGGHRGGLKDGPAPHGRSHELRVFAGGFYFDDDDALEEVAGPRARIEWRVDDVVRWLPGSRLTFEGEFQYDDVREDQWEGGVRFRVPFGGGGQDARATLLASLTPQERRMTENIVRDTDIVTAESEEENVFDTATGVNLDRVAFASDAGSLAAGVGQGANTLIIAQGNGGVINLSATNGQALQANQTLQGGSSTIQVTGRRTGTTAGFTAPGARPTFFSNDGNANTGVITVASNTHVAGLNLRGVNGFAGAFLNDNRGVFGPDGASNVVLEQLDIRTIGDNGIEFLGNNNNIVIRDSVIDDINDEGIEIDVGNNFLITNIQLSNIGEEGIDIDDTVNVTVTNVSLSNIGEEGIQIDDATNVIISGATISGAAEEGIDLFAGNRNVTISNTTIINSTQDAIEIDGNNQNITIVNTTITNTGFDAIFLNGTNISVTINNTTFNGTIGDDLLDVQAAGNTVNGTGNVNNAIIGGALCEGAGNFTGTLEISGTVIVNGGPPCI